MIQDARDLLADITYVGVVVLILPIAIVVGVIAGCLMDRFLDDND